VFGLHVCRGNRRSMWHRSGSYDPIAERLFTGLAHQRLLLEYDSPRAGSFEPLRFVPADKTAVLGLITTKVGQLEDRDTIRRRIEEASRHVPLDQLALSPQCGFGSDIQGNQLGIDEQWRKLELVMSIASETWG
jgi:5-methyltetrahydropteroyltriglutamate--homocysteine methyltransferase